MTFIVLKRIGVRDRSHHIAVGIVLSMSVGLCETTAANFFRENLKGWEKCEWGR